MTFIFDHGTFRWAVILAFDVKVERDAQEMADSLNVKIFSADIIYHLFDSFLKHREVNMHSNLYTWCDPFTQTGTKREEQAAVSECCCVSLQTSYPSKLYFQ